MIFNYEPNHRRPIKYLASRKCKHLIISTMRRIDFLFENIADEWSSKEIVLVQVTYIVINLSPCWVKKTSKICNKNENCITLFKQIIALIDLFILYFLHQSNLQRTN